MDSLLQGMRSTARDRLKYEADRRGREIYKARANKRNLSINSLAIASNDARATSASLISDRIVFLS